MNQESQAASVRVAFIQTDPAFGDVTGNLREVESFLPRVADAEIIVLPELFATGYAFLDREELAEIGRSAQEPTLHALREWARASSAWIVGGFVEWDGDRAYNAAALVGADGTTFIYRKAHLFDRETLLFDAGDGEFRAWDLETRAGTIRVGVMICFDWLFPEAARCLALDGAEILLHPSNLVLSHCQNAMPTRCLENRVFAVTANRVGRDRRGEDLEVLFTGASQVTAPDGTVLVSAAPTRATAATVVLDLAQAREKNVTPRNHLFASRRPELYGALAKPKSD